MCCGYLVKVCVCPGYLIEACVDVLATLKVQLCAANIFSESGDPDDVGRLQVLDEEVTAGLGHILHLVPGTTHTVTSA